MCLCAVSFLLQLLGGRGLPCLGSLTLLSCALDASDMWALLQHGVSGLSNLRVIDLSGNGHIGDGGVATLADAMGTFSPKVVDIQMEALMWKWKWEGDYVVLCNSGRSINLLSACSPFSACLGVYSGGGQGVGRGAARALGLWGRGWRAAGDCTGTQGTSSSLACLWAISLRYNGVMVKWFPQLFPSVDPSPSRDTRASRSASPSQSQTQSQTPLFCQTDSLAVWRASRG